MSRSPVESVRKKLKTDGYILAQSGTRLDIKRSGNNHLEESTADISPTKLNYFSNLPNEILLYICDYLSPVDIQSLYEVGEEHLRNVALSIKFKEANFSCCRRAEPQRILAFFTRDRVQCLKELNFNYNIHIKPSILAKLICRCKQLSVLSIVDCGLKYSQLVQILKSCTEIEQLSWDVNGIETSFESFLSNAKEIYLYCDYRVKNEELSFLLKNFPTFQYVWINFSSNAMTDSPFVGNWLGVSHLKKTNTRRVTLLYNSYHDLNYQFNIILFNEMICDDPDLMRHFNAAPKKATDSTRIKDSRILPYLQIQSNKKDIADLSSESYENAFPSLILSFTSKIGFVWKELSDVVYKVSGKKLKHVAVQRKAYSFSNQRASAILVSADQEQAIYDTLQEVFFTCNNITVLTLVTLHFTFDVPSKCICNLKSLETLSLPVCAFFRCADQSSAASNAALGINGLKDLAANCTHIENLTVYGCCNFHDKFHDEDLNVLQDFKRLKVLTIASVRLRSCRFLKKVADSCSKLTSLSLISIMVCAGGIYVPDLAYLLRTSENLIFLRINEETFTPTFENFWPAVAKAKNLEGLCIITKSGSSLNTSPIIQAVTQLKYLNLFHFYSPRAPAQLYHLVMNSMRDHGICVGRIESYCNVNADVMPNLSYYHQEPPFSCQHSHFNLLK